MATNSDQKTYSSDPKRVARLRAIQAKRRKQERQFLHVMTVSAAVLLVVAIICIILVRQNSKTISNFKATVEQLEEENEQLSQDLIQAQSEAAEAQAYIAERTGAAADGFFDDALIVGDSVSYKLELYVTEQRNNGEDCLDEAQFFTAGSLSWGGLLLDLYDSNAVFPSYEGTTMYLEDAVSASGANKVYIMLGMNDVALYGIDQTILNIDEVISRVLEDNPDTEFFIESVTPMLASVETSTFNNDLLSELNEEIKSYCQKKGYSYLDIASVVSDEDGNLLENYCSDATGMGMHFTDEGCAAWIDYLEQHPYGE